MKPPKITYVILALAESANSKHAPEWELCTIRMLSSAFGSHLFRFPPWSFQRHLPVMLMLRMSSHSMLGLRIFACLERLSRFARQSGTLVQIRIRLFACFACRCFLLSFFGMFWFVDCVCFWSFVRFILSLTIFNSPRALCSYSSRLDRKHSGTPGRAGLLINLIN